MTRGTTMLIAGLAALVACSPERTDDAAPQSRSAPVGLEGRWRVLSIDGRPPVSRSDGERAPVLSFSAYEFGGTVGCNGFGGYGLLADGRYATHGWVSDAMACLGPLGDQEEAVRGLFLGLPRIRILNGKRVRLESASHAVELERAGANSDARPSAGPGDLAGTTWRVETLDGNESMPARPLRFTPTTWSGSAACATLYGTWRRAGDRILVGPDIATTEQNCPPDHARIDKAFAELMSSNPRYLVGPNGELLIAGGGHALAGERAR